jgi:hypothetical protein
MADEEKSEQVTVGRAVEVENVFYGPGTYKVTPSVAKRLRARNATASAAETIRQERESKRGDGDGGGDSTGAGGPEKTGVIIGGGSKGEGEGGGASAGGSTGAGGSAGGSESTGGGAGDGGASASAIDKLEGELPDDFPKRAELAKGAPDADPPIPPVTRYEELTRLTREQLDAIPGIGEASIDIIGQRLFADAGKLGGGEK